MSETTPSTPSRCDNASSELTADRIKALAVAHNLVPRSPEHIRRVAQPLVILIAAQSMVVGGLISMLIAPPASWTYLSTSGGQLLGTATTFVVMAALLNSLSKYLLGIRQSKRADPELIVRTLKSLPDPVRQAYFDLLTEAGRRAPLGDDLVRMERLYEEALLVQSLDSIPRSPAPVVTVTSQDQQVPA